MSDMAERHPITLKRLACRITGMESVPVRGDVEYASDDAGPLLLDVYHPTSPARRPPVVVIVAGYPDVGVPRRLGCAFKEMEMTVSLAQLIAMSGMAAAAYTTRQPASDIHLVLAHLASQADALLVDAERVGLWAMSGNVPVALAALIRSDRARVKAAVLSNGFTFDATGSAVADAARSYGFVNASAGHSAADLPADVPLFLTRSGGDEFPGLNDALDRFVADALARNLPLTLVNHRSACHGFELHDDSDAGKDVMRQMLEFMRFHLNA